MLANINNRGERTKQDCPLNPVAIYLVYPCLFSSSGKLSEEQNEDEKKAGVLWNLCKKAQQRGIPIIKSTGVAAPDLDNLDNVLELSELPRDFFIL